MTSSKTGLVHGHILPPLVLTFLPCLPSSPPACSGCNRHWKHQITSDHSHLKSIPKAGAPTVRFTPVFMAALFTLANKVETTQLSINRGIDKNVVHTCNKMLRSHKNGDKVLMCAATGVSLGSATESVKSALRCNRGEPWERYGISEISPHRRSEVHDSTCMRDTEEATSWRQKLELRLPEQRAEQDITVQWAQGFCLDGENILGMHGGGGWCTTLSVY